MPPKITPLYAETRILLALWSSEETALSKSNFVPSGAQYKQSLSLLEENGTLSSTKVRGHKRYSLTKAGLDRLSQGLMNDEFLFLTGVGAKTVNAVLKWFRSSDKTSGLTMSKLTFEDFSESVADLYQKLDSEYNLDGLVPIYRVRREIGKSVEATQFDEWLLELQANDALQLMGGDLSDMPQDQKEESVQIPGGGLRFYIKLL